MIFQLVINHSECTQHKQNENAMLGTLARLFAPFCRDNKFMSKVSYQTQQEATTENVDPMQNTR